MTMKARNIKPGDTYTRDGATSYVVLDVDRVSTPEGEGVNVLVRYEHDSGQGRRFWLDDDNVPLERPTAVAPDVATSRWVNRLRNLLALQVDDLDEWCEGNGRQHLAPLEAAAVREAREHVLGALSALDGNALKALRSRG